MLHNIDFQVPCCRNCKRWSVPQWDTNGFGICAIRTNKSKGMKIYGSEGNWFCTPASHLCIEFQGKK